MPKSRYIPVLKYIELEVKLGISYNLLNFKVNNFTLIMTSSLLAAFLTSFANWLLQRNNYRDDYYKKVIEKRMATYEKISKVMGRLQIIQISNKGLKYHDTLSSQKEYSDFIADLASSSLEGLWIGSDCSRLITNLNVFLHQNFNSYLETNWATLEVIDTAVSNYHKINEFREAIRDQTLKDLLSLHHVTEFLNTKR